MMSRGASAMSASIGQAPQVCGFLGLEHPSDQALVGIGGEPAHARVVLGQQVPGARCGGGRWTRGSPGGSRLPHSTASASAVPGQSPSASQGRCSRRASVPGSVAGWGWGCRVGLVSDAAPISSAGSLSNAHVTDSTAGGRGEPLTMAVTVGQRAIDSMAGRYWTLDVANFDRGNGMSAELTVRYDDADVGAIQPIPSDASSTFTGSPSVCR